MKTVTLKIKRQDSPSAAPRWEEFTVPWEERLNVHAALMAIQRQPKTTSGQKTTPVAWDANCLEEVCGSCTMIINGQVMQACSTLTDNLGDGPIELRPMTKFPLIRDLCVDRTRIFSDFKRVHAWIDIDGTHDLGPGLRQKPELADTRYELSRCMACGCCLEACPNYGPQSTFIGAAPISQARLFNLHPSGEMHKEERLESLMEDGGVEGCGNAQNCVQVCPKEIPLTTSIADMNGQTAKFALSTLFRR